MLKKISENIFKSIKKITKIVRSYMTFNNMGFFISVLGVIFAILSFSFANKQFKKNSEYSDSVFNVQLRHSEKLNDSLINQIAILQSITNLQLAKYDSQLIVASATLEEEILIGRPFFQFNQPFIIDSVLLSTNQMIFRLAQEMMNTGKRFATEVVFRPIILVFENGKCSFGVDGEEPNNAGAIIEPGAVYNFTYKFSLPFKTRNYSYFYCYEIKYYDERINKYFDQSKYMHLNIRYLNNKLTSIDFILCNDANIIRILKSHISANFIESSN